MELDYRRGRPLLFERHGDHMHLHVGRGTTTMELSLFLAVVVVWVFDLVFLRDPLHLLLLLLLPPFTYRAFRPLVQIDIEAGRRTYVRRRTLFGIGPRHSGRVETLHVDFEECALYDGSEKIAPLTEALAEQVDRWLADQATDGFHLRLVPRP